MRRLWLAHRLSALTAVTAAAVLSLAAQGAVTTAAASAAGGSVAGGSAAAAAARAGAVRPRPVGELDCNGLSPDPAAGEAGMMCADPRGSDGGRFYENGHYIGHDEPSVRFLSSAAGLGNNMSITETAARRPEAPPTVARPGQGRHALVRAVARALVLDHRLRS